MIINYIKKLYGKYGQSIRFVCVGIYNTFFGYFIFCILDTIFCHFFTKRFTAYMLASVFGTIISILNAYVFHRKITFRSKVKDVFGMIIEFFKFSCTYSVTFFIGIISLPILVEIFNFNPKIAAGLITLFCTVISYYGHLKFSFKKNI